MSPVEFLRVALFAGAVFAVYVLAGWVVVNIVRRRRQNVWFAGIVLVFAATGMGCLAWGYFVEPYSLSVSHVVVPTNDLTAPDPVRVVHISDLHSDPVSRLEEALPDRIAAEKPDVIVFTGDAVNSPEGLPVFKSLMTRLASIAPTYAVRGNWDTGRSAYIPLFEGTGVHELNARAERLRVRGSTIWVIGLPMPSEAETLHIVMGSVPLDALTLLLYHSPDLIEDAARLNIDLYCAGHTHGGQVALPGYGALVTFSTFGKRYESGLYRVGDTTLYVNRGIGMEGGAAPRVRFWAPPELTVIDLVPAGNVR